MIPSVTNTCPLCGNHDWRTVRNGLLLCNTCNVMLNPQVWEEGVDEANEDEWFDKKPEKETSWARWFQAWNNKRTYRQLKKHLSVRSNLLEIGAGSGSLLRFLRKRGLNVEGCDLAQSICDAIRDNDGIPMYNCPVGAIPQSRSYDVIVMNHVLEHVSAPVQFLKDVLSRLGEGGIVHIAVPNVWCWEAFLSGWVSYEPYHLIYYNPVTLRSVVEKAGFEVLRIGTHDSFSGWFLALLRTLLRTSKKNACERFAQRKVAHSSWVGLAYHLAMVLSGFLTLPLRLLQDRFSSGDEIVLVARKMK